MNPGPGSTGPGGTIPSFGPSFGYGAASSGGPPASGWAPAPGWSQPPPDGAPGSGPPGPPNRTFTPADQQHPGKSPRAGGGARLIVLALVAALLGGGVGGFVGYRIAADGSIATVGGGSSGVLGDPLPAADSSSPAGPLEAVAQKVLPSVVQLRVSSSRDEGEGSGMVLSRDGLILTNNHVVADAASGGSIVAVFQDGRTAPVSITGRDPSSDLAVVRARDINGLTPVQLGNSDGMRVGQQVVAFGSPLGLGGTVTTGIISALDRAVSVGDDPTGADPTVFNALQTDAAINPGNSGGPLVDMQGRVIGINSAIATTGAQGGSIGVGFAIPINPAKRIAQELESTGRATRAVLGVGVTEDPTITGARIESVVPGGPADRAGIKRGDVVVRVGDKRVATGLDLQAQVRAQAPGGVVPIQLSNRTVQVTLGSASG